MEQMIHLTLESLTLLAAGLCLLKCRSLAADVKAARLAAERAKAPPKAVVFDKEGRPR